MSAPKDTAKQHPALAAFDGLYSLRQYLAANPSDVGAKFVGHCALNLTLSRAQLFQDLFVLMVSNSKKGGFFVEFGATNGVDLSNTFLLEDQFGWNGILAEPARCWHNALKVNRKATIDLRCVWSETGRTLEFKETAVPELSTLSELTERDFNRDSRKDGKTYTVETVSLNDLLRAHNAPKTIDYLSVDTEGSELQIFDCFDFSRYDVNIITVEHNFCEPERSKLHTLLTATGFIRVFEALSKWDDWYVKRSKLGPIVP